VHDDKDDRDDGDDKDELEKDELERDATSPGHFCGIKMERRVAIKIL
jgi:hypothetical protein